MSRFENIVIVVEGSGTAEQIAQFLLKLPLFENSKAILLHAVPPQISAEKMRLEWEHGQQLLAKSLQALTTRPGIEVTTQLVEGDPKQVVCNIADKMENALVIIGARSRNRIAAILENSVSQYVFQLASCPMLLVREDIYVKQPHRIMVTIKDSPIAKQAFDIALNLAKGISGAHLFLARIQLDAISPTADPILDEAIATVKRLNIPYTTLTGVGDVGSEITRLTEENKIDFLVMGSPERRPTVARSLPDLDRLLGSSTSDYVRVHAQCPVLMVRTKQDTE